MAREAFDGISQQSKAGRQRLKDAQELASAERWQGAMYMAGYAVECLLKSKLMRMHGCRNLRELEDILTIRGVISSESSIYTHNLNKLVKFSNASNRLKENVEIFSTFNLVNQWMPAWRYSPRDHQAADAQEFLKAVEKFLVWIDNNI